MAAIHALLRARRCDLNNDGENVIVLSLMKTRLDADVLALLAELDGVVIKFKTLHHTEVDEFGGHRDGV